MPEQPKHPDSREPTPLEIRDPEAWRRRQRSLERSRKVKEYAADAARILALVAAVSIPASERSGTKAPIEQEVIIGDGLSEKQRQLLEKLGDAQRNVIRALGDRGSLSNLSVILTDRSSAKACDAARGVVQGRLPEAVKLLAYLRARVGKLGDPQLEDLAAKQNAKLRQTPQEVSEYFEQSAAKDLEYMQNDWYYQALVQCTTLVKGGFYVGVVQSGIREKVGLLGPLVAVVAQGVRNKEPHAEDAAQALIHVAEGLLSPYTPARK